MRRIIVNVFTSLDGVVQAPGGPGEDRSGGFILGGWTVALWDAALDEAVAGFMEGEFDLLLGRGTFDIFASQFPFTPEDPLAMRFTAATKYVVTHRPLASSWTGTVGIEGNVVEAVRGLKAETGPDLHVHGSPGLAQTLQENNLVDEYRVWTFPVLLGHGKKLFAGAAQPVSLKLERSDVMPTGVIISVYRVLETVETSSIPIAAVLDPDPELRET